MSTRLASLVLCSLLLAAPATAEDSIILVGGEKEAGQTAAGAQGGSWVNNLTKGFLNASNQLNAGGAKTVVVKVAGGEHSGDLGAGSYLIPAFNNPQGTLRLVGGFGAGFGARDPFGATMTRVVTVAGRGAPLWQFTKNSKLKGLVIDGLLFDCVASNKYSGQQLLVGSSSTHRYFDLELLETDELTFKNCVFMNSADKVLEPLIRAASNQATINFVNCVFFNCRVPLKLESARYRNKVAKITVDRCSFLLNWSYNPDPTTSNPCALEVGSNHIAGEVAITNNLFFANFGGAVLALEKQPPPMTVSNNCFMGNGLLHGQSDPDAVAMIVTAGGKKLPLKVAQIEDVAFVQAAEGNVSIDPALALTLSATPIDSSGVKANDTWENAVNRLLGRNQQGGTVEVKEYAPAQAWDPAKVFTTKDEAKRYGASPTPVE
jgi:hypothetical protein